MRNLITTIIISLVFVSIVQAKIRDNGVFYILDRPLSNSAFDSKTLFEEVMYDRYIQGDGELEVIGDGNWINDAQFVANKTVNYYRCYILRFGDLTVELYSTNPIQYCTQASHGFYVVNSDYAAFEAYLRGEFTGTQVGSNNMGTGLGLGGLDLLDNGADEVRSSYPASNNQGSYQSPVRYSNNTLPTMSPAPQRRSSGAFDILNTFFNLIRGGNRNMSPTPTTGLPEYVSVQHDA